MHVSASLTCIHTYILNDGYTLLWVPVILHFVFSLCNLYVLFLLSCAEFRPIEINVASFSPMVVGDSVEFIIQTSKRAESVSCQLLNKDTGVPIPNDKCKEFLDTRMNKCLYVRTFYYLEVNSLEWLERNGDTCPFGYSIL